MLTYEELAKHVGYALLPITIALPRVLAALSIVPITASLAVPMMVRMVLTLSLALFLYPLHDSSLSSPSLSPFLWTFIIIKEILIGFCIGFVCSIFIWVVEGIGSVVDTSVGNNNLFLFNPMLNQETGPFSSLMSQFGVILFIVFGGFILLLQILFTSFVSWPVLSFTPTWSQAALTFFIARIADMLNTSLQLAMPVLTVLMLVDFGLGLINRTAPQFNAFYLSMPLKALVSVLFLMLTLIFVGDVQGPLRQILSVSNAFLSLKF